MHPGIDSLNELTDNQLEDKITQLSRYYHFTSNDDVRRQMILILDEYKLELETRRVQAKKKMQQDSDNDLDNLINIS